MTLESREQSPRLGASTRAAELAPLSSPGAGGKLYPNDAVHLDTCCHELTHVAQYQAIGLIYIPEAIHAQHTGGYTYGNLATARQQGKTYRDFNREQQAQIAGDFYRVSVQSQAPSSSGSGSLADYTHFITQMRSGGYW